MMEAGAGGEPRCPPGDRRADGPLDREGARERRLDGDREGRRHAKPARQQNQTTAPPDVVRRTPRGPVPRCARRRHRLCDRRHSPRRANDLRRAPVRGSCASIFAAAGAAHDRRYERMWTSFFVDAIRLRTRCIDDFVHAKGSRPGRSSRPDGSRVRRPQRRTSRDRRAQGDYARDVRRAARVARCSPRPASLPITSRTSAAISAPNFDDALTSALEARGFRRGKAPSSWREGVLGHRRRSRPLGASPSWRAQAGEAPRSSSISPTVFEPDTADALVKRAGFTCSNGGPSTLSGGATFGDAPGAAYIFMGSALV